MSDPGPQKRPASTTMISAQNKQAIRELAEGKSFALYIGGSLHGQIHEVKQDSRGLVRTVAASDRGSYYKIGSYEKEMGVEVYHYHLRKYQWSGEKISLMYVLDGIDRKENIENVYLKEPGMVEKLRSIAIRKGSSF